MLGLTPGRAPLVAVLVAIVFVVGINISGVNTDINFWVISTGENLSAYNGLIWTVNWKLGMKAASAKLKVIKNQY